jgi:hypothetical protein
MNRTELAKILLPMIARVECINVKTAERVIEEKTTNELSLLYNKYLNEGHFQRPAPPVTAADVQAERERGEAALANLRDRHAEALSRKRAERNADALIFQRQQYEADSPRRQQELAKAQQAIVDAHATLRTFALNDANISLLLSVIDPANVSAHTISQAIASDAVNLAPPTAAEKAQWAQDDIAAHNARLCGLNPLELRVELKKEQAANRAAQGQREENLMLEEMRLRDQRSTYHRFRLTIRPGSR